MKVAILGASDRPERYANKAMNKLEEKGHQTYLVNPKLEKIGERPVFKTMGELKDQGIHTLAMYVNPKVSSSLAEDIVNLAPKRIIFNPGTENNELYSRLKESGIDVLENCVLILLSSDSF